MFAFKIPAIPEITIRELLTEALTMRRRVNGATWTANDIASLAAKGESEFKSTDDLLQFAEDFIMREEIAACAA